MRKAIPAEETYKYYGGSARQIEIGALRDHGIFIRVLSNDAPRDGVCIRGRFAYTTKRSPLQAGHEKSEAYVGNRRMLDARFARNAPNRIWGW